ncbi:hypothetical protein Tco_0392278, partial [Tanacetum coccineum]
DTVVIIVVGSELNRLGMLFLLYSYEYVFNHIDSDVEDLINDDDGVEKVYSSEEED